MTVYDNQFNANEWSILLGLLIESILLFVIPKRFPRKISIVIFTCGVFSGFLFDHSLSVEPVSFYDVNDKSTYQLFDFLSYLTYGPICYLFFYMYDRMKRKSATIYILIWSLISVGIEWYAVHFGVFHYRNGYKIYYSFLIYLIVQSCWMVLYKRITLVIQNYHV
ncbi:MAG: hypothetical protein ACO1OT_12355 [Heyndrickxia sp.]